MNALLHSNNGYLNATKSTGAPREVEYRLFSRVTGNLKQAMQPEARFSELVAALVENETLWRTLALDVIGDDNQLPPLLRARLFYLYEFTCSHTSRVMRREADPQALVDINVAVMSGLKDFAQEKGSM